MVGGGPLSCLVFKMSTHCWALIWFCHIGSALPYWLQLAQHSPGLSQDCWHCVCSELAVLASAWSFLFFHSFLHCHAECVTSQPLVPNQTWRTVKGSRSAHWANIWFQNHFASWCELRPRDVSFMFCHFVLQYFKSRVYLGRNNVHVWALLLAQALLQTFAGAVSSAHTRPVLYLLPLGPLQRWSHSTGPVPGINQQRL